MRISHRSGGGAAGAQPMQPGTRRTVKSTALFRTAQSAATRIAAWSTAWRRKSPSNTRFPSGFRQKRGSPDTQRTQNRLVASGFCQNTFTSVRNRTKKREFASGFCQKNHAPDRNRTEAGIHQRKGSRAEATGALGSEKPKGPANRTDRPNRRTDLTGRISRWGPCLPGCDRTAARSCRRTRTRRCSRSSGRCSC